MGFLIVCVCVCGFGSRKNYKTGCFDFLINTSQSSGLTLTNSDLVLRETVWRCGLNSCGFKIGYGFL
jgi:hypothetical protein